MIDRLGPLVKIFRSCRDDEDEIERCGEMIGSRVDVRKCVRLDRQKQIGRRLLPTCTSVAISGLPPTLVEVVVVIVAASAVVSMLPQLLLWPSSVVLGSTRNQLDALEMIVQRLRAKGCCLQMYVSVYESA